VLIAAGKAADAMVRGVRAAGLTIARGMIATTHVRDRADLELKVFLAGHPVPTAASEAAGHYALELARSADAATPLVVLLSGGASALLVAPAEGLTLDDKMRTTRALLGAGAAIHQLNAVRKHLSAIKGGQLAMAATGRGARVQTLAVSDVISPVEDDPGVIGSGPTSPDASSFDEALSAIAKLGVREAVPASALRILEAGAAGRRPETPKPGDPRLANARFTLIGSRRDAMRAAQAEAERRGLTTVVIDEPISGEARDTAPRVLKLARSLISGGGGAGSAGGRGYCVIASGETTVRVTGSGRGGRNQEFALALAEPLAADAGLAVSASVGTDGIDGPTDAAGGIVDSTTMARAASAGLDSPRAFLSRNDAYNFLAPLGDLVQTGPTDTNVCDLQLFLFA
jgi:hydroxypyruvate reductase